MGGTSARRPETSDSTPALLVLLLKALARRWGQRLPPRVLHRCMSACGLVALLTPLGLWVAWSKLTLGVVLLAGFSALVVFLALLWMLPGDKW